VVLGGGEAEEHADVWVAQLLQQPQLQAEVGQRSLRKKKSQ